MRVGVSLMPGRGFRDAVAPLFAAGAVEAVEWTLDMGFGRELPAFVAMILDAYAPAGALYGHGTGYSPLSAGREDRAAAWLDHARAAAAAHRYAHVTEHFGFCAAGSQAFGPPLPVPADASVVRAGVDRLRRLRDAVGAPVGLENLALAFSRDDALAQGDLLDALLAPVDGVMHLDVHNLWAAAVNFGLDPVDLALRYPLHRARIAHVSGGTWVDGIRRDTHDDAVPADVLDLLAELLPRMPGVEAVLLERIGTAFATPEDQASFREDFARLAATVAGRGPATTAPPPPPRAPLPDRGDVGPLQVALVGILASGADDPRALLIGAAGPFRAWAEAADPRMLGVAAGLVARWGRRDG